MDTNLAIQYTVVGILVAIACVWIIIKAVKTSKGESTGCAGCALAEKCNKKGKKDPPKPGNDCPQTSSDRRQSPCK